MSSRLHDALFKSAFEAPSHAAELLRDLLPPALREAIAWRSLLRDRGSFIDPTLADRHNDLLFSARLPAFMPGRLFLLLEHQSTSDPALPLRVLSYQTRIWDRFRKEHPRARLPPILSVLVSHAPRGWSAPLDLQDLFDPRLLALPDVAALVPRCSMISLDLTRMSNAELQARTLAAFPKLALWLLRDARDPARLLANFHAWAPALAEAGQGRSGLDDLAVLIQYMFQVLDPVYWDELRARILAPGHIAEGATMTIADMFREEGRVEGRAEGRVRGREEGRAAALRSLLLLKFHALDATSEARLQAASSEAIDRYLARLLTADSLAAVFAD